MWPTHTISGPSRPSTSPRSIASRVFRLNKSSLYGAERQLYAVVNLITRSGHSLQRAGRSAPTRARLRRAAREGCTADLRRAESSSCLSSIYRFAAVAQPLLPRIRFAGHELGMAVGLVATRTADAFGKLTYQLRLFEAGVQGREKEVPTASFETTFDDPRLTTRDGHAFAVARSDAPLCRSAGESQRLARLRPPSYTGTYPYDGVVQRDLQSGDWWTLEGRCVSRLAGFTSWCSAASMA